MQISCAAAANETSVRITGIPEEKEDEEEEEEKEGEREFASIPGCPYVSKYLSLRVECNGFRLIARTYAVGYSVDCHTRRLRNSLDNIANLFANISSFSLFLALRATYWWFKLLES